MSGTSDLELLFQYASEYKFSDFTKLFQELEAVRPLEDIWEAYLMRAQIKLYAADDSIGADLDRIARFDGLPRSPCLAHIWTADAPNRFIVFSKAPGALGGFLQALPRVRQKMGRWYGQQGDNAIRQIQAEINYFLGEIDEALGLAEEQHLSEPKSNTDDIMAQALCFRCNLALGRTERAEECMLDLIRLARAHPECLASYQALRGWANLTTNWNGDSPRFYKDPKGRRRPVLEDRLAGIRMGIAKMTPLEGPFVSYAESGYQEAYALRRYYMDLFHAMYWHQAGDNQQTESYFRKLYQTALDSGVLMPLVECGEQVTPLLHHVKDSNWGCSRTWLDEVISRAEQYEKSLNAYQNSET